MSPVLCLLILKLRSSLLSRWTLTFKLCSRVLLLFNKNIIFKPTELNINLVLFEGCTELVNLVFSLHKLTFHGRCGDSLLPQLLKSILQFLLKNLLTIAAIFGNLRKLGIKFMQFFFGFIIEICLESELIFQTCYFSLLLSLL